MKMLRNLFILLLALITPTVFAHPGHGLHSVATGFAHPLSGLDHILTMVAIGLWAGLNTGKTRWTIIGMFLISMLIGGLLGASGIAIPSEAGIIASVALSGLLVACLVKVSVTEAAAVASIFALFHGHAHGLEMAGTSFAGYGFGYSVASCLLLLAGLGSAVFLTNASKTQWVRYAGGAICCCTLFFI